MNPHPDRAATVAALKKLPAGKMYTVSGPDRGVSRYYELPEKLMNAAIALLERDGERIAQLEEGVSIYMESRKIDELLSAQGTVDAGKAIAWMRRWHYEGEKEFKVRNPETGRVGLHNKFKWLPVTLAKHLTDDIPLFPAPAAGADAGKGTT